jgi:ribosomal protein S18 acetylase RimI-like enzyme
MNLEDPTEEIRKLLETDRLWSAYALADLDPLFSEFSDWYFASEALLLIYRGLEPPVLFALGQPQGVERLFSQVPQDRYTYTLLGYCREMIRDRLKIESENHMWRMGLKPEEFPGTSADAVVKLRMADLDAIQRLFNGHPDQPDAFMPSQIQNGIFYGIFEGDELISLAGTHILSHWASVAAIGNVFTRPDLRGKGLATRVTAAVVRVALDQGIETVVLNVGMDNAPALACYRKLGFWPYCGYYEGTGTLTSYQNHEDGELNE